MSALFRSATLALLISGCPVGVAPAAAGEEAVALELSERDLRYFGRQFRGKCALCHGKSGDGTGLGAAGAGAKPADFTDAAFMATRSDAELFQQIRIGGEDRSAMPAFGPGSDYGWTDEKIRKMVAYLRTFAPEAGRPEAPATQPAPSAPAAADRAAEGFEQVGPLSIVPVTVKPDVAFYSDDCGSRGRVRGLLEEKNYEEVYQSYSYFEAWYDRAQRVVEFKEYRRGDVILSESYSYDESGRLSAVLISKRGEKDRRIEF
jgi:mono/diheme cytochrome c family protein